MSTTPIRLTRRQWLELPPEWKTAKGEKRYIVTDGRLVPIQWCAKLKDSHLQQEVKEAIDTAANRQ